MKQSKLGRIKILHLYTALSLLIIFISVFLMVGSYRTSRIVADMHDTTSKYIEGQNAVNKMMRASDILTEKARLFVVQGDKQSALDYFDEVNNQKNRELALRKIAENAKGHKAEEYLTLAMRESEKLADIEKYAIKLGMEGYDIKSKELSENLKDVKLTRNDDALSDEEKKDKSVNMMLNDKYKKQKSKIMNDVGGSLENLVEETRDDQLNSYKAAKKFSDVEHILIFIAIISILIMLVMTAYSIIIPIKRSSFYIKNNQMLPLRGAAEYVYLAETYNKMLSETKKHHEELSYEATHDELTGLYNRKMFEAMRDEIRDDEIAMLIIDLDNFKYINDHFGHDTGDKVLQKVANGLSSTFRFEDLVCRVGGDEFVVVMINMKKEMLPIIEEKIQLVQDKLAVRDELPKITISIGVAFNTDREEFDTLYKNADAALYEAKNGGKDGFSVY